jgi:hypothetical protein
MDGRTFRFDGGCGCMVLIVMLLPWFIGAGAIVDWIGRVLT